MDARHRPDKTSAEEIDLLARFVRSEPVGHWGGLPVAALRSRPLGRGLAANRRIRATRGGADRAITSRVRGAAVREPLAAARGTALSARAGFRASPSPITPSSGGLFPNLESADLESPLFTRSHHSGASRAVLLSRTLRHFAGDAADGGVRLPFVHRDRPAAVSMQAGEPVRRLAVRRCAWPTARRRARRRRALSSVVEGVEPSWRDVGRAVAGRRRSLRPSRRSCRCLRSGWRT